MSILKDMNTVKSDSDKFSNDFIFELSQEEINFMVSQNVIPSK